MRIQARSHKASAIKQLRRLNVIGTLIAVRGVNGFIETFHTSGEAMSITRLSTSKEFMQEVLDYDGPVLVVFPGAGSLISDFIQQQLEIVGTWREEVKTVCYTPGKNSEVSSDSSTLIALYLDGIFVGATSKYCFAEHVDAWLESSLIEFKRLEADED